jgi:SNF2 family DNA or RNA helicase
MEISDVAPSVTPWAPTDAQPEAPRAPTEPEASRAPTEPEAEPEAESMDTDEVKAETEVKEEAPAAEEVVEEVKAEPENSSSQETDAVGDKRPAEEPADEVKDEAQAKRPKLSEKAAGKLPAGPEPEEDDASSVKIKKEMDAAMAERALISKEKALKEGQLSKTEDKNTKFTNTLTGNTKITKKDGSTIVVQGILRTKTRSNKGKPGRPNNPYKHQRVTAKEAIQSKRLLICHDPGLGKTFTFLLSVAAMHVIDHGRQRKTLISAPASCLDQWLSACLDSLRIPEKNILKTNELKKLNARSIRAHDIIIVSRETLTGAFSTCYEWQRRHHQNERGNWCSDFGRIDGSVLHPIFEVSFDLVGIDEVHCEQHPLASNDTPIFTAHSLPLPCSHYCCAPVTVMRNPVAKRTKAHELISMKSSKVLGLSASPIFNNITDAWGLSIAMDMPPLFKDKKSWFVGKDTRCANMKTVKEFAKITSRVTDEILDLPPITDEFVTFDANIDPEYVSAYNDSLSDARNLKISMERRGRVTSEALRKLMSTLQTLQQFVVSPVLAENGAADTMEDPDLIDKASRSGTGSLIALKETINNLNSDGINNILVAVNHVSPMKIAEAYLKRESPGVGNIIMYTGSLNLNQRQDAKEAFITGEKVVMLMSIEAGGTGLHLVDDPCTRPSAVIFWGSRPFSPMQIIQTKKRVHRIGQKFPVKVLHLIAEGSVDSSINFIHGDKLTLAKAVVDNETEQMEQSGGMWRTSGRIVDQCRFLTVDGQFATADMDETDVLNGVVMSTEIEDGGNDEEEPYEEEEEEEEGDEDGEASGLLSQAASMAGPSALPEL